MERKTAMLMAAALVVTAMGGASALQLVSPSVSTAQASSFEPTVITEYVDELGNSVEPPAGLEEVEQPTIVVRVVPVPVEADLDEAADVALDFDDGEFGEDGESRCIRDEDRDGIADDDADLAGDDDDGIRDGDSDGFEEGIDCDDDDDRDDDDRDGREVRSDRDDDDNRDVRSDRDDDDGHHDDDDDGERHHDDDDGERHHDDDDGERHHDDDDDERHHDDDGDDDDD